MATGHYQDHEVVERFLGSVADGSITQQFIAPYDFDVLGLILVCGTAPGATHAVSVNVQNFPTSQNGGSGTSVAEYNLWTTANQPTVTGTAVHNLTLTQSVQLVENIPYALNYPLPGPSGTQGYVTAQSTSQTTTSPVTTPPLIYKFGVTSPSLAGTAFFAPDNTYTDYNGITGVSASRVHAGDILTFNVLGASLGSAANLNMELVLLKS